MEDIKFEYEFSLKSIKEHRESKKISQLELSRLTLGKIPQSLISELEGGTRMLTGYTSLPLSNALRTNVLGLCLGQEMANKNIPLENRERLLDAMYKGNDNLISAYKSLDRVKKLDFGDRDSLGRKKILSEGEKRAEKSLEVDEFSRDAFGRRISPEEAKKRREESLDLGDRNKFGLKKIVSIKMAGDLDDLDLEGLTEKEKYLAKLKRLLEKGEERRRE